MGLPSEQTFWAPPPPGLTKTNARIGPDVYEMFTYRCEVSNECFALEYSKNPDHARRAIEGHICPAPPRRDQVPAGKTIIQKLWDELDELMDQIKFLSARPDVIANTARDLADKHYERIGQARGIALALALLSVPWFRTTEDILRQANKRWKMRQSDIPWEPTPGYNYYPAAPLAFAQPERTESKPKRSPVKSTKSPMVQSKPAAREFSVDERLMIQESVHSQGVSPADLAKMFGVTEDRIKSIAGPPPSEDDSPLIAMF